MLTRIVIRRMTLEDISRVHEIDKASFSLPWPERSFKFEVTENQASRPWVAEIVSEEQPPIVVGMVVVWLILDEAHIGTFAIDPEYRQRGLGQKLLAAALLDAEKSGAKISLLEVRRSNLAAQKLYEKFGFITTTVRSHYYRDNNEDALLMNLDPIDPPRLQCLFDQVGAQGTLA